MHVRAMTLTHPSLLRGGGETAIACVNACLDCAQACIICADACLAEQQPDRLGRCIGLNLACADLCRAAANVESRRTCADGRASRLILEACARICRLCADECATHAAMHEHCRICADVCRACEEACLGAIAPPPH